MADYYFAPSELTILPGETVAFVNVQGIHDVDGLTNTLTGEPWNNPAGFYLPQTVGTELGTCMGVVTFDIPGVYNFDSSIGFQAQLGMVGSITVDAFTILDLLNEAWAGNFANMPDVFASFWAMQYSCPNCLAAMQGLEHFTVFLPDADAISALQDLMNLNQFDMLNIPDLADILEYHFIENTYLTADLEPGMVLPTLNGEGAVVGENGRIDHRRGRHHRHRFRSRQRCRSSSITAWPPPLPRSRPCIKSWWTARTTRCSSRRSTPTSSTTTSSANPSSTTTRTRPATSRSSPHRRRHLRLRRGERF